MKDIARAAGVHQSAVSLALRNHPRIGKATRTRIVRIADRLGYRPDPMLSALAAYRSARREVAGLGEIALLHTSDSAGSTEARKWEGIRSRAEAYGYTMTPFDLGGPDLTPGRLNRILRARGIQGVILERMILPRMEFLRGIEWERLTAVRLGRFPKWPPVPCIEHNQFSTMQIVLQKLLRRGYRRIGLIHEWHNLQGTAFFPEAAYLHTLHRSARSAFFPVFYVDRRAASEIPAWADEHRFDAIVSLLPPAALFPHARGRRSFLERHGFACLNLHRSDGTVAGMDQQFETLGARAADTLVAQINRGDRGFPAVPTHVLIEGVWREGATIRPARTAANRRIRS